MRNPCDASRGTAVTLEIGYRRSRHSHPRLALIAPAPRPAQPAQPHLS